MRTALRGFRQGDLGKIIENAIYLKLLQDGWTVSVGVLGDREIDSVGTRGDAIVYIQAATIIANEETRQREFGNLLKIDDTIPSTLSAWIRSARMTAGYVIWACASFSCWKRNQNRGRHAPLSLHRHAAFTRTWLAAKSRQKS